MNGRLSVAWHAALIWLLLCAATCVSWRIAVGHALAPGWFTRLDSTLVLLIAMVKTRLVLLNFMGLKNAPLVWRLPFELWVIAVGTAMLVLYIRTSGP